VIEGVGTAVGVTVNGDDAIAGTLDVGVLTLNTGSHEVQAGDTLHATTALLGSASSREFAGFTVSGSGAAAYFGTIDLDVIWSPRSASPTAPMCSPKAWH